MHDTIHVYAKRVLLYPTVLLTYVQKQKWKYTCSANYRKSKCKILMQKVETVHIKKLHRSTITNAKIVQCCARVNISNHSQGFSPCLEHEHFWTSANIPVLPAADRPIRPQKRKRCKRCGNSVQDVNLHWLFVLVRLPDADRANRVVLHMCTYMHAVRHIQLVCMCPTYPTYYFSKWQGVCGVLTGFHQHSCGRVQHLAYFVATSLTRPVSKTTE